MKEKSFVYMVIAVLCSVFLLFMLLLVTINYRESLEYHTQVLDEWHNKCDSLLYKNEELYEKVYELQDSILMLKYKEK